MSRVRLRAALLGWALLGAVLIAITVAVSLSGDKPLQRTVTDFLLVAILAVGVQMFTGNSGIVSFGHMAFAGIGAYTAALVTIPQVLKEQALPDLPGFVMGLELGTVLAVVVGGLVATAVAAAVGGAMARMRELAMAMATLALLVLVHAVLANWNSVTRGGYGIYGIPSNATIWVALVGLVLVVLVARVYRASQPGLRLQATREDPLPASAVGVNVVAERFTGWVLSAAVTGAGGALLAQHILAFDPDQFYFALTFTTLSMVVIGGTASVTGAVVGAGLITAISEALRQLERGFSVGSLRVPELPGIVQLSIAVLIVLVLIFRRTGLFGRSEAESVLLRFRRRRPEEPAAADESEPERARSMREGPPVLRADAVTMDFAGLRALDSVTLELGREEILGLIGPNGSGKTTLLNVVSGVFRPTRGRVVLGGRDVTGWPAHRVARLGMARTFQNIRLFGGLTVEENVRAAAPPGSKDADVRRVLERLDLAEHADDVASTLAYGIQRRVEIARAVVRRPSVLLLDEPAAGMNEAESEQLLATILAIQEDLGCAVVAIDHDLRLILRLCDRVQVLNEGITIADGEPNDVARRPAVAEAYLGTAPPAP